MNVSATELGPCKKLLRIEAPLEDVEKAFHKVISGFRSEVALPGFRKGKAPKNLIEQRYGKDIEDEARRELLRMTYDKALKQEGLRPVIQPELEIVTFERDKPFEYTIVVESEPDFTLPEYKGTHVQAYRRRVTDDDVERVVTSLREKKSGYSDYDGSIEDGHIAVINFVGKVDGQPISEISEASSGFGKRDNYWVSVREGSFLPGFTEELVGLKPGDKKTIEIALEDDFVDSTLAGKTAQFEVEVTGVKQRALPEVDESFAKSQNVNSVEELYSGIRASLEDELKRARSVQIRNNILGQLLQGMDFPLPESVVESEADSIVYEMVFREQQAGASEEDIEQRKDEIYANAKNSARMQVRSRFLVSRIAREENIEVSEDEVRQMIANMAMRDGVTDIRSYVKELQEHDRIPAIVEDVRFRKTLDLLELHAQVEEVPMPETPQSDAEE